MIRFKGSQSRFKSASGSKLFMTGRYQPLSAVINRHMSIMCVSLGYRLSNGWLQLQAFTCALNSLQLFSPVMGPVYT